jgi:CRP/FNR family transcriptional activator FtrB
MTKPAPLPKLSGLAGRLPHDLDRTLLAPFLETAPKENLPPGTLLFEKGGKADRFAWIEDGMAELFVVVENGEELLLDLAARGAMLGDIAAATGACHLTSSRAVTPLRIRWIDAQAFQTHLSDNGQMGLGMLAGLCLRLRRLVKQIDEMKLRSATRRLAGFLLELAQKEEGPAIVALPFEKKTLARHVGMTSQSLSRSLKALGARGVSVKGRKFHIQECQALRDYHDQEEGIL